MAGATPSTLDTQKRVCTRSKVPWEDLPVELLSIIVEFLTVNPIDFMSFRCVCKSWNFSADAISFSPSPFILSIILPMTAPYPPYSFDGVFFGQNLGLPMISVTSIFVLHPPFGQASCVPNTWLLFADQLTPGKIVIRRPFSKCSYAKPSSFPAYLNVPHIPLHKVACYYNFSFHPDTTKPPNKWSRYFQKVVLFPNNSGTVVLFRNGTLGYSKFHFSHNWVGGEWEPVGMLVFDDIIDYMGMMLAVDGRGRVYEMNCHSFRLGLPIVGSVLEVGVNRMRLMESLGRLYLICRTIEGANLFKVFKLDEEATKWVEVDSIADRIFFVGLDFSFSLSVQELGGSFGKNCIVYEEDSFLNIKGGNYHVDAPATDDHIGDFGRDDLHIRVYHLDNLSGVGVIGSYPGYSSVLWPPPAWLWPKDISHRIEDLETAVASLPLSIVDGNMENASELWVLANSMKESVIEAREMYRMYGNPRSINISNVSEQRHNESTHLHNQVELSTDETEARRDSVDLSQTTARHSDNNDKLILPQGKLDDLIFRLEEYSNTLQEMIKSRQ